MCLAMFYLSAVLTFIRTAKPLPISHQQRDSTWHLYKTSSNKNAIINYIVVDTLFKKYCDNLN